MTENNIIDNVTAVVNAHTGEAMRAGEFRVAYGDMALRILESPPEDVVNMDMGQFDTVDAVIRVAKQNKRAATNAADALRSLRESVQSAIDEIRDQLKEGNSVTIGDWDDLGAYFAEIPGIDAGPPVRCFSASITITATVDLSGHAPKDLDKGEVANRIRNVLSLIHEFDIVDDSDNDELFEIEQDSSSIDFDAESITISFA